MFYQYFNQCSGLAKELFNSKVCYVSNSQPLRVRVMAVKFKYSYHLHQMRHCSIGTRSKGWGQMPPLEDDTLWGSARTATAAPVTVICTPHIHAAETACAPAYRHPITSSTNYITSNCELFHYLRTNTFPRFYYFA